MIKKLLTSSLVSLLVLFSLSYQVNAAYVSGTCLRLTATGITYDAYDENTSGQISILQDFLIWKRLLVTDTGNATGYFGVKTLAAVRAYQSSKGIQTTGTVGPLTKAAIETETCTTSVSAPVTGNSATSNSGWGNTTASNSASNQNTAMSGGWGTVSTSNQTTGQGWTTANNQNTAANNTGWGTTLSTNQSVSNTGGQPTCSITTLKSTYAQGETVYVGYYSTGATTVSWVPTSGLTGVATDVSLPPSGSAQFLAAQVGSYTLVLRPYSSSGIGGICTKAITITPPTQTTNSTINFSNSTVASNSTTGTTNTSSGSNTSTSQASGNTSNTNTTTNSSTGTNTNTTDTSVSTQLKTVTFTAPPSEPLPAAPTLTLSLKKSTLAYGEQWGELIWSAPADALCERYKTVGTETDFAGTTTPSGTYKFGGDETTTYTMKCYRFATGASGNLLKSSTSKSVTVTVPQTAGILRMRSGTGLGTFETGDSYATKELALARCQNQFEELMKVSSTSMSCTWNSQPIFTYKGTITPPKTVIGTTNIRSYVVPENSSRYVSASSSEVVGRFSVRTINETSGATITRLGFLIDPDTVKSDGAAQVVPNTVKSITVNGYTTQATPGNNYINMIGLNIPVPEGGTGLHFNVIARTNCVGTSTGCAPSNSDLAVKLLTYGYTYSYDSGLGGVKTVTAGSNTSAMGPTYKLVSSKPNITVTKLPLARLTNFAGKVGEFQVAAESTGSIALVEIPITLTKTGTGTISPGSVELRNADGTVAISGVNTLSGSGIFKFTTPRVITKGTSETFTVYASSTDVTGPSGSSTISFSLGNKSSFLWDDVTGGALNLTGTLLKSYPEAASTTSTTLLSLDNGNPQVLGASTYCANLQNNLMRGSESGQVTVLQSFLIAAGYLSGNATGFYGDKTVSAVKNYQLSKGLPVTGMVYDFTRAAIKEDTCQ